MKYYKVLKADGSCANGGSGEWFLPTKKKDGTYKPGKWMPRVKGKLEPCMNGYHICRPQDLAHWLDEAIFEVEYKGRIVKDNDKCVVREARLLRRIETWDEKSARLFAADCAEKVLPTYEKYFPNNDAPRKAIQVARDYANGKINKNQLDAASAAASAVARDAASAADCAAARTAARAAWDAASAAASAAARDAASAAARAARDAAREWQAERLFKYLEEQL